MQWVRHFTLSILRFGDSHYAKYTLSKSPHRQGYKKNCVPPLAQESCVCRFGQKLCYQRHCKSGMKDFAKCMPWSTFFIALPPKKTKHVPVYKGCGSVGLPVTSTEQKWEHHIRHSTVVFAACVCSLVGRGGRLGRVGLAFGAGGAALSL